MQLVGVILLLISIGTAVGPIGAVVVMNSDDLTQIVIPPEIEDILSGDSSLLAPNLSGEDDFNIGLIMPKLVSSTVDTATQTFSITVNVTNVLNYDLTLNSLTATVIATQGGDELAAVQLSSPVTIPAGEWSMVTVSGTWTQAAEDYYTNNASSIDVTLASAAIDVNGIVIQMSEPIVIGDIPLTLE